MTKVNKNTATGPKARVATKASRKPTAVEIAETDAEIIDNTPAPQKLTKAQEAAIAIARELGAAQGGQDKAIGQAKEDYTKAVEAAKQAEEATVSEVKSHAWAKAMALSNAIKKTLGKGETFDDAAYKADFEPHVFAAFCETYPSKDEEVLKKKFNGVNSYTRRVVVGYVNGFSVKDSVGNLQKASKELKAQLDEAALVKSAAQGNKAGSEREDSRTHENSEKGLKQSAEQANKEKREVERELEDMRTASVGVADLVAGKVTSVEAQEFIAMLKQGAKDLNPAIWTLAFKDMYRTIKDATETL